MKSKLIHTLIVIFLLITAYNNTYCLPDFIKSIIKYEKLIVNNNAIEDSLSKLINIAKNKIIKQNQYTKDEAFNVCSSIANLLHNEGIKLINVIDSILNDFTKAKGFLFSDCLKNKGFECNSFTLTYYAIAKELDLPLYPILAPKHIFLEWDDGINNFFWEPEYDTLFDASQYIKNHNITKNQIEKRIYLSKLNENQLIANYLLVIIEHLIEIKDYKRAEKLILSSLKLDNNESTLTTYGDLNSLKGNNKKAISTINLSMIYISF